MPIRMYNCFCRKERKGRKEMELNEFKCRMCGACCRINPVKPDKCRTFPFEWTNPDSVEVCPGLATVATVERVCPLTALCQVW